MLDWLFDLIGNPFLIASVSAWFVAQSSKAVIYAIINKEFRPERLIGDGGMPSCHSATVAGLAAMTGLKCGFGSFEFAAALILSFIVCHDATGVRLETGKQAVVLNELLESLAHLIEEDDLPEAKLKEFVGHTLLQVLVGAAIGIVTAFLLFFLFYNR